MPRFLSVLGALAICMAGMDRASRFRAPAKAVVAYVFAREHRAAAGADRCPAAHAHQLRVCQYCQRANGHGFEHDAENFSYLESLKKQNPSLTVLVSVGGWLWSTNFSDMALTAESRAVFIQSVMEFLTHYKLDGLDIDWEYPGNARCRASVSR